MPEKICAMCGNLADMTVTAKVNATSPEQVITYRADACSFDCAAKYLLGKA